MSTRRSSRTKRAGKRKKGEGEGGVETSDSPPRTPLRTLQPQAAGKRKKPNLEQTMSINNISESTPVSSGGRRDSLFGFEDLDSPITFSPIVDFGEGARRSSTRSHSPASTISSVAGPEDEQRSTGSDVASGPSSSLSRKLSDKYYQPLSRPRARRRRPKKETPDQLQAQLDEWARKMNAEFAEIEKVQLDVVYDSKRHT